jgi:hypothetical protein
MFYVFRELPDHIIKLEPHCNHHTRSIMGIHFKNPDEKSFQDFCAIRRDIQTTNQREKA